MTNSILNSWKIIEKTLQEHSPKTFASLAKPASKKQIAKLESIIKNTLPSDLKESLLIHNGMVNSYLDINRFFNYEALLSTATIAKAWGVMAKLTDDGHFDGIKHRASKTIKSNKWWNKGWIPITDADGDCFCIDLDPILKKDYGQIFYFYHDSGIERNVISNSFKSWLSDIANKFKNNKFEVDDGDITIVDLIV